MQLVVAEAKSERDIAKARANEARDIQAQLDSVTVALQSAGSEVVRLQQALARSESARESAVSRALTAEPAASRAREESLQLNGHLHEARMEVIELKATAEVLVLRCQSSFFNFFLYHTGPPMQQNCMPVLKKCVASESILCCSSSQSATKLTFTLAALYNNFGIFVCF